MQTFSRAASPISRGAPCTRPCKRAQQAPKLISVSLAEVEEKVSDCWSKHMGDLEITFEGKTCVIKPHDDPERYVLALVVELYKAELCPKLGVVFRTHLTMSARAHHMDDAMIVLEDVIDHVKGLMVTNIMSVDVRACAFAALLFVLPAWQLRLFFVSGGIKEFCGLDFSRVIAAIAKPIIEPGR